MKTRRILRAFATVGLLVHGLAHAGVGAWLTNDAYAHGNVVWLVFWALAWTFVTSRFMRAGFIVGRNARAAAHLATSAAFVSLFMIVASGRVLWIGIVIDMLVIVLSVRAYDPRVLLVRVAHRRLGHRFLRRAFVMGVSASALLWPWYAHWGSTDDELRASLPGDAIMTARSGDVMVQHAITIQAPPNVVWAWLVQIGQGRGGFYSYDRLESAFGLRMKNAETIDPALQSLSTGDFVRGAPEGWLGMHHVGWEVAQVEPGRVLVLKYWGSFVLVPEGKSATRLIARTSVADTRDHPALAAFGLFWEPIHFFMQRKMLLGIAERAERTPPSAVRGPEVVDLLPSGAHAK